VAFDVNVLAQDTSRRVNNCYVSNTQTLNWDSDNLQLCCRWFAFFNVAFLKLFHLAEPLVIHLFLRTPEANTINIE